MPSWTELQYFFAHGSTTKALRKDARLEQIHWSTTRTRAWPQVLAIAFDHRAQLEEMADAAGITRDHIPHFKKLCLSAARRAAAGRSDFGILLDRRLGQEALDDATGEGMWIGRPIELPGSIPLRFEGGADVGCTLREWPAAHCVKCLVFYHPDDPAALKEEQEAQVLRLFDAARQVSEIVGRHLMRQHPKDITLEWSVPKRTGKIFMDYNMNVRGKTLNVAYSPRGAPGAPISMPLTWDELVKAHPLDFRLPNAAQRLARTGDRWRDALDRKQSLERALSLEGGRRA